MRKKLISGCTLLMISLAMLAFVGGCSNRRLNSTFTMTQKVKLTIGSTGANLPLLKKLAEAYMDKNKNVIIEIPVSLDNDAAFKNVRDGNVDAGLVTIPNNNASNMQQKLFARTIMVFAVNPSVTVPGLTKQQILEIYSGKIKNWHQVGGPDGKIVVVVNERGKPARMAMDKFIKGFLGLEILPDAVFVKDYQAVNEGITSIRNSIGWTDIGAIQADDLKIKPLAIEGIMPTVENFNIGRYPMSKDLYLLTLKNSSRPAKDFVDFVSGWEGKKVIMDNGYLVPDER